MQAPWRRNSARSFSWTRWSVSPRPSLGFSNPLFGHHVARPHYSGGIFSQLSCVMQFTERAPAKVNLFLHIQGRRADGFHELESLVVFAPDVSDHLSLAQAPPKNTRDGLSVEGEFGSLIDTRNLVLEACAKVRTVVPELPFFDITLEKALPVAAGLGGGSADAAAVIRAIQKHTPTLTREVNWHDVACDLGADVPVCMRSQATFMTGIGETLQAIRMSSGLFAVLVNAGFPVPQDKTAQVFQALAAPEKTVRKAIDRKVLSGLTTSDQVLDFLATCANDLAPAIYKIMPRAREVVEEVGALSDCKLARLSGAGPTVFGLFETKAASEQACETLQQAHPEWWIRSTILQ